MNDRIKNNELFDYYGVLLTEEEQEIYMDYNFNDLSLSEIAEQRQISRNAVHKRMKRMEQKLNWYEQKLKYKAKMEKIKVLVEQTNDQTVIQAFETIITSD